MAVDLKSLRNILGINRRNLEFIYPNNPRSAFPLVDDKVQTKKILSDRGIPVPETYTVVKDFVDIRSVFENFVSDLPFVVKPARGRAGGGILLVESDKDGAWATPSGRRLSRDDLYKHIADILFGVYSFGRMGDRALVERRIVPHSFFQNIYKRGIPDIRIITFREHPVMAMLRIPTDRSDGKANLHQGAIGLGIDLLSGKTEQAFARGRIVDRHPDSGSALGGLQIPYWKEILNYAVEASKTVPLGYLGIDLVIDSSSGPLILELNARPGLQIQVVNRSGLRPQLERKV